MVRLSLPPKAPAKVHLWEAQHGSHSDGDLVVIEEDSRGSSAGHSEEFLPTKASGSEPSSPRQRPIVAQPASKIHLHQSSASPTPTAPLPHTLGAPEPHSATPPEPHSHTPPEPQSPTPPEPHPSRAPPTYHYRTRRGTGAFTGPRAARGPPEGRRKAAGARNRKRGQRNQNGDAVEQAAASAKTRKRSEGAEGEDIGERVAGEEVPTPLSPPPAGPEGEDGLFPRPPRSPRRAEEETRCPLCDKTFPLRQQLTSHLELHALRYRCLPCERRFGSKSGYYQHRRVHERGRAFLCALCPVGFYTKSHLAVHGRLHTGERPFPCPQCPKRFFTASCIRRHMLSHNGVKPHRCPQCGKDFSQNGNLKKHMATHPLPK